jgi:CubicO group peptidase (beta-lactamase class C family)
MPQDIPPFSTFEELHTYLEAQTDENLFSGVVLVAHDGQVLFHKAYGMANKRYHAPNQLDTKFNLGSINKFFTTITTLQLMGKGLLSLDDPLSKHRGDFPSEIGDKVTIRHLLRHRAGFGNFFDDPTYQSTWTTLRSIESYMAFIKGLPLEYKPGEGNQYSNTGFVVLGAVIEAVTGQSYYDVVCENIYEPAGMKDTDSYEMDLTVENLAMGYTNEVPEGGERVEGYLRENIFLHSARGVSAGGGFSTAGDLLKFDTAFRQCKLLTPGETAMIFNQFEEMDPPPEEFTGTFMIVGGAPGINTAYGVKANHTIIVLSNYDPPGGMDVASKIMGMIGEG